MPFQSQAQRAKFYADPKLRKYAAEWERETPKNLPKKKRKKRKLKKRIRYNPKGEQDGKDQ